MTRRAKPSAEERLREWMLNALAGRWTNYAAAKQRGPRLLRALLRERAGAAVQAAAVADFRGESWPAEIRAAALKGRKP
jgi:hypothetical protein